MDVNEKVKELEDELKLLKAGIQNVLLDIRENILERRNPLADEQSAHITMDLNTTARAMASEAVASEARKATEALDPDAPASEAAPAVEGEPVAAAEALPSDAAGDDSPPAQLMDLDSDSASKDDGDEGPQVFTDDGPADGDTEPAAAPDLARDTPVSKVKTAAGKKGKPDVAAEEPDIPDMFMADLAPLSGDGSLADWVTSAIDDVGVEDLRRVISMFRLWGNVPPNISRALAHLQELLTSSDDPRPPWLKVLQDLDKLASL